MVYFLLFSLLFIQILTLIILVYLYFKQKTQDIQETSILQERKKTSVKNIIHSPQFELVKQVIQLDKFTLGFKTPYAGYLYITAQACDLYFSDDSFINIKTNLDKLYLEKGEIIFIKNPINLKSVRFVQY